jgi:O-antigen ligase
VARLTDKKIVQARFAFWLLALFLFVIFLSGGSARLDVVSLAVLRPLSIAVLGCAVWMLRRSHIQTNRFLFWSAMLIVTLLIVQLIPLPTSIWNSLPGRGIIFGIDHAAGNTDEWRPISLAPGSTSNALYALSVPLAVLLLAIQLDRQERYLLLPLLLGLGLLSGIIGLLQAVNNADGPLYLYRITNEGAAVGLFANRNHQALLLSCLFPMLAVFASTPVGATDQATYKSMIAIGAGIILVPLLLVTGSRAGLFLGIFGLASVLFLYRKSPNSGSSKRAAIKPVVYYALGGLTAIALGIVTVIFSRGRAIDRLAEDGSREEIWRQVADIGSRYFPFGTGAGTFAPIYQLHEVIDTLRGIYTNQAHNDFLDLYLTSGIFGMAFLLIWIIGLICTTRIRYLMNGDSKRSMSFTLLGTIILSMMFIASIADYPLRTPIITTLFIIAAVWMIPSSSLWKENAGTM